MEPIWDEKMSARAKNEDYQQFCVDARDGSSPLFQHLYLIVPSVLGQSIESAPADEEDKVALMMLDEIAETYRCRQLPTYTQVMTLLMTYRTSRPGALDYLHKMPGAWPLYRGVGPISRPRPLSVWNQQYENIKTAPDGTETREVLKICATLDLVVFRLHNASGYPLPVNHTYQLSPINTRGVPSLFEYNRIGIEWNSLWSTLEGRKEFRDSAVQDIVLLLGRRRKASTQLYWLVDGIPRPQWTQYPPAIPAAFNRVIEKRKDRILRWWEIEESQKAQLLKRHDLYQELEANGRRY
jgi:hypothetical protein